MPPMKRNVNQYDTKQLFRIIICVDCNCQLQYNFVGPFIIEVVGTILTMIMMMITIFLIIIEQSYSFRLLSSINFNGIDRKFSYHNYHHPFILMSSTSSTTNIDNQHYDTIKVIPTVASSSKKLPVTILSGFLGSGKKQDR